MPLPRPLVSVLGYRGKRKEERRESVERAGRRKREGRRDAENISCSLVISNQPLVHNAGTDEAPCATMNFFFCLFPSPFAILSFLFLFFFFLTVLFVFEFLPPFFCLSRAEQGGSKRKKTESSRLRGRSDAREHKERERERRFAGLDEKLNERKTQTWRFTRTGEQGEDTYREIVSERSKRILPSDHRATLLLDIAVVPTESFRSSNHSLNLI